MWIIDRVMAENAKIPKVLVKPVYTLKTLSYDQERLKSSRSKFITTIKNPIVK